MSPVKIFFKVMLPFSMPNLMAGLRIGATLAVIGITVGELVGGETGLGYLITFGQGQANTAMVFDAIGLLTVIGIAMYWAVADVESPRAALRAARPRWSTVRPMTCPDGHRTRQRQRRARASATCAAPAAARRRRWCCCTASAAMAEVSCR